MTTPIRTFTATLAFVSVLALPAVVRAQTQTPAPPPAGAVEVSQLDSGIVAAPEVRFTKINDRTATLAGGYVGWHTEHRLLVGAAGYWLTNRSRDFEVQYGGGLVRWTFLADEPVAISTGVLAGFGSATLVRSYGDLFGAPRTLAGQAMTPQAMMPGRDGRIRFGGSPVTASTPVRVHDDFLVAEPQVNVVWTIARWVRLDAGAGYRFIGSSDLLGHELRGASGSIALQFSR